MASPQIENGYTKIANELLEEFIYRDFPGREIRLLLFVIRRTYGFNRTEAPISLSEFSAVMGKNPQDIVRLIQNLENQNILKVIRFGTTKSNVYSINKDYDTWKNREESLVNKNRAISMGASSVGASSVEASSVGASSIGTSSVGAISTTSVGATSASSVGATRDGIINSYNPQPEQAAAFDFLAKESFKESIKKSPAKKAAGKNVEKKAKTSTSKINGWQIWIDANRKCNRADPRPIGKCTACAKRIAAAYGNDVEALLDLMVAYLQDEDKFLVSNGHSIVLLESRIEKYRNLTPEEAYAFRPFTPAEEAALEEADRLDNEKKRLAELAKQNVPQNQNVVKNSEVIDPLLKDILSDLDKQEAGK